MRGDEVDRPPLMEEGVREEVLELWQRQGMPEGRTHVELFGLSPHETVGPDITPAPDYVGRILDLSTRGYRKAFHVSQRRFPHDWKETVKRLEDRDHVVCIWASRGFLQALGVGDWPTLERVLIATLKEPQRIRDRMEMYGEFCSRMLERTMQDVDPEFIYLSEPISDNHGPLISPASFEEFMKPVHERIVATARGLGCRNLLFSTYGNSSTLFPIMLDAGISMLWISEGPEVPELDYRNIRGRFGPELGLIGGIPLSILRSQSPEHIRERLEAIVPPLLESGRYVPLAGGRVREEIPWPVYRRYREVLAELMG
jgi:hypothetical protein